MKPAIKAKLHQLKMQLKQDEELRRKDPRRAEVLRQQRWKEEWQTIKNQCVQLKLL
jgi:hypothetical protein